MSRIFKPNSRSFEYARLACVVSLLGVTLAGCGGGGSDSADPPAQPPPQAPADPPALPPLATTAVSLNDNHTVGVAHWDRVSTPVTVDRGNRWAVSNARRAWMRPITFTPISRSSSMVRRSRSPLTSASSRRAPQPPVTTTSTPTICPARSMWRRRHQGCSRSGSSLPSGPAARDDQCRRNHRHADRRVCHRQRRRDEGNR